MLAKIVAKTGKTSAGGLVFEVTQPMTVASFDTRQLDSRTGRQYTVQTTRQCSVCAGNSVDRLTHSGGMECPCTNRSRSR